MKGNTIFLILAIALPLFARALTIDEMQTAIDREWERIANRPPICRFTGLSLKYGARNSDVVCLQRLLNSNVETQVADTGAGSPGMETSYFGALTRDAVKRLQQVSGLTVTGTVGTSTVNALYAQGTDAVNLTEVSRKYGELLQALKEAK